ncbi:MAG: hypothetical protein GXO39_08225, partial [Thermotogae bacterium]|nr:hypothetical protein [Thermotogota bacterium]
MVEVVEDSGEEKRKAQRRPMRANIRLTKPHTVPGGKIELVNVRFEKRGGSSPQLILSNIPVPLTRSNFYIQNLDLSEADRIEIANVYLEEMRFTNVNWGDMNTERFSPELLRGNPRAARDIYRQIKLALDSQENYIDARKFYA